MSGADGHTLFLPAEDVPEQFASLAPDSFAAAWAEAEAALPEGWQIDSIENTGIPTEPYRWRASSWDTRNWDVDCPDAHAATPAEALRALAAKLREMK